MDTNAFTHRIFTIQNQEDFNTLALEAFRHQAACCAVYADYIRALSIDPGGITSVEKIPFLPVSFFKTHQVRSNPLCQLTFTSSGTTGMSQSRHLVSDVSIYEESFFRAFEHFYGDVKDYTVIALLPSYLEREGSSLIYMVEGFMKRSESPQSGFYLYQHEELYEKLKELSLGKCKILLIGVSFALWDFAQKYQLELPDDAIVMETGGMKGRKKEITRAELHSILHRGFGVKHIHSEYGMTELLSQGYSQGNGIYNCPPWMRVVLRPTDDPLGSLGDAFGTRGGINVIDLANIHSCSFIATEDLGRLYPEGSFEVLGRFSGSDLRGCNLLLL